MYTKREVVEMTLSHQAPPYVPWHCGFTYEANCKLQEHFGCDDIEPMLENHLLYLGNSAPMQDLGDGLFRDVFGAVWDRSRDRDTGVVKGCVLSEPDMSGYKFPDPTGDAFFGSIDEKIAKYPDRYRIFAIDFSLFERAWILRGMENLMMDFIDNPGFVHELLAANADFNIAMIEKALEYDIDGVHFGDDWGQQHGLIMGPKLWREFIYPQLKRMYSVVKSAGKRVSIHSCGDVDELFEDLIDIGLDCFNPFQPEVMDVDALMKQYKGRLAFYGGLSTQHTLPYGTADDVRRETRHLLENGSEGGYIFAPAHSVEGDVPLENLLAFIDEMKNQPGYK